MTTKSDVTDMARRLSDADLIGFDRDGAILATAKLGFTKNPDPTPKAPSTAG